MPKWTYCDCAGKHRPGCPNAGPGGLPPLTRDEDEDEDEDSQRHA